MPRKGIMLCYPFEEKRLIKWLNEDKVVVCQPKLNGVRAWWDGQRLWSSEGNIIGSVPHILKALSGHKHVRLDGELYHHGSSLQHIRSIVGRTVNIHPEHRKMGFYVFDIKSDLPQHQRIDILYHTIRPDPRLFVNPLPSEPVSDVETVVEKLKTAIELGFEGIVLRRYYNKYEEKRSTSMMKWKPAQSDTYIIVELIEGKGKYEGTLGALTVMDPEKNEFNVGSFAIDDSERDELWRLREGLAGNLVKVRYFELTESGIPPSGVFECLVEE